MQNDLFALRYCFYYHCCCCCCCCYYCCCCCRGGGGGRYSRRLPDFLFRLPPTKTFPLASTTTTDLSSDKKKKKTLLSLSLSLSRILSSLSLSLSFSHKRESKLLQSKTPNLSEFFSFTAQTKSFSLKALRVPQLQSSNQELLHSLS